MFKGRSFSLSLDQRAICSLLRRWRCHIMNLIMAKKNKGPDILIKLLSLALSNTSQFLVTLTSIHKVKQMTEGLWVHFFKDVGSWWQMSVNMHYAFNVWKSLLWHWHFGYRIIKGMGQRRHVFISQCDRRLELSAFQPFLCSCLVAEISLMSLLFNFFVLYLSISPPLNQSPGEDITFSVCERTIISVNFILSRPCCRWKPSPLNSF